MQYDSRLSFLPYSHFFFLMEISEAIEHSCVWSSALTIPRALGFLFFLPGLIWKIVLKV